MQNLKWYSKPVWSLVVIPIITGVIVFLLSPLILNPLCSKTENILIKGIIVLDSTNQALSDVEIVVNGQSSAMTGKNGDFELSVKSTKPIMNKHISYLCTTCEKETSFEANISYNGEIYVHEFNLDNEAIKNGVSKDHLIKINEIK